MARTLLITGGSGYFGSVLVDQAIARGDRVRIFDINPPDESAATSSSSRATCATGTRSGPRAQDIDAVLHNVAQVPLAKDNELFWSVNVIGTANVLLAARDAGVAKIVHTSSSAIFGIPEHNPVTEETPPHPLEDYGRAKLAAELLCHEAMPPAPT